MQPISDDMHTASKICVAFAKCEHLILTVGTIRTSPDGCNTSMRDHQLRIGSFNFYKSLSFEKKTTGVFQDGVEEKALAQSI